MNTKPTDKNKFGNNAFGKYIVWILLVTVTERSKACTVFARSEAGIVGSNPIQGIDVWCICMPFPVFATS
jgi:hypothetical protein